MSRPAASLLRDSVPLWILVLFGLGVLVRVVLMAIYPSGALQNLDTVSYVTYAPFFDTRQPSGIQLFIEPFKWVGSLELLIASQHALGLTTALLVTLAVRRLRGGWGAAGGAAAVTLFGSNQLYIEHALLTETLFTTLVAGALLATLYSDTSHRWPPLLAGALAGSSLCTRSVGLAVIVLATLAVIALATGPAARRALRAGMTVAGAGAVVGAYMLGVALTEDGQSGIGSWSGWYSYARAAPFADCREFTPPPRTERLCEDTPPSDRHGPAWYMFDPESPARQEFDRPPYNGALLADFGRSAMLNQPLDYMRAVVRDLVRYLDQDPDVTKEGYGGGYESIALDRREPADELVVAEALSTTPFGPVAPVTIDAEDAVGLYASLFELSARVLALLVGLSAVGLILSQGRTRVGAGLYSLVAVTLLVMPVLTVIYNARYALPAQVLLAVPAAIGAQAIADRLLDRYAMGRRLRV